MEALIYTQNLEPAMIQHDSVAIRLATVLGSHMLVAGSPAFLIHQKQMLEERRGKTKVMLTLMRNAARSEKERAEFDSWLRIIKSMNGIKHLDKRGLVIQQQVIRSTANLFQFYIDDTYRLTQSVTGLPSLEVLINEEFTGFIHVSLETGKLNEGQHDLADMFRYDLDVEREPFIPMVGGSRLEYIRDHGAHHVDMGTDTTIVLLEGNEMLGMRTDLLASTAPFRTAMEALWQLCMGHPGPEVPEQALADLNGQVVPAMQAALQAYAGHPLQASFHERDSGLKTTHLGVGLCPYRTYIEAYREAKMIDDRNWAILTSAPPDNLPMPGWVPYIATHLDLPEKSNDEEEVPLRTLDID